MMPLPLNPPAMPHMLLSQFGDGVLDFVDGVARDPNLAGFWFWRHADRPWVVGPYRSRKSAVRAYARYLSLEDGPELRVWVV